MSKKSVILIDPQEIFLCGLIKILEEEGNLKVLDYTNIYDEISVILNKNADYYLICPEFEEDKENNIIRMAIDKNINNMTIFMINELSNTHEYYIKNKMFRGFIHKKAVKSEFIGMIKNIVQNNYYVDPKLANKIDQKYNYNDNYVDDIRKVYKLTYREYEIFYLLSNGLSNIEIADRLCISEKTVRNNLTAIYKKLNLNTRSEAILFFHKINKNRFF